jgi:hypothetical protein
MKKRIVCALFLAISHVIIAEPNVEKQSHSVEIQIGAIGFGDYDTGLSINFLTPTVSYIIPIMEKFRLGGYLGLPLYIAGGSFSINTPFPLIGIRSVFGNKAEGFAFSTNIGIIPSLGFYYKNIFLNIAFAPFAPESDYAIALDIGYSIDF